MSDMEDLRHVDNQAENPGGFDVKPGFGFECVPSLSS